MTNQASPPPDFSSRDEPGARGDPAPLSSEELRRASERARAVAAEVARAFIGPPRAPEALLAALLARGHVLLEGVPGVAKTTLAKAFAAALGASFGRVQFTPDLLPADITGTHILDQRSQEFCLHPGPIFAHVVLGDEINRAPAKTQSALLESMQERQVTIDGATVRLPSPFMVVATQNPIEHEGTYPLPDAQVDRFLLKLQLGYPSEADELRMLEAYGEATPSPRAIVDPEEIARLQARVELVYAAPEILAYILGLARYTRRHPRVELGASPRAALSLLFAAKALALARGRGFVIPDDIQELAPLVLAHRLVLGTEGEVGGDEAGAVIGEALGAVPYSDPRAR